MQFISPQERKTLLAACRRGDRRGQETLYRKSFPYLLPIVQRYLRDQAEAVSVLNQAMLRIFQSLPDYREQEQFEGWLATIVRRAALNFIRDEGRARRRFHPEEYPAPVSVGNTGLANLAAEDIMKLLETLPDYLRIVFSLYVFDDYSHPEIARELEITAVASRWRLSKARELLRDAYLSTHEINKQRS
jgi:RNA polymerase sigma factor (sigma-70 family)